MRLFFWSFMKKIRSAFQDLMLIIGYSSLVYGVYLLNKPAAYIVGGLLLLMAFVPKTGNKTGGN